MLAKSKIRQLLAASRAFALRVRDYPPRDVGRGDGDDGQHPRGRGDDGQGQAVTVAVDQAAAAAQDGVHPQGEQQLVQQPVGQPGGQPEADSSSIPTPPITARPKAAAKVPDKTGEDATQMISTPIRFGPSMSISNVTQQIVVGDDLTAVKTSEVALQGVETKVSLIEVKFMRAGRQNYRTREGADPEKE